MDGLKSCERIACVDDNLENLLWRLKIINSAKKRIEFATFSFLDDRSGRDIMSALYAAANRGVKVRILVDGVSPFLYLGRSKYFNVLAKNKNIKIKIYNPIHLLHPWNLSYRMHDKYIISDNKVFILGGRNIKNLSLGNYQEKKDIDRDVVVYNSVPNKNDSLHCVRAYFENIWSKRFSKVYRARRMVRQEDIDHLHAYYENIRQDFPSAFETENWEKDTIAVNKITFLANPVNKSKKVPVIWDKLTELTKKGKNILIQTPYIMCNKKMYRDLTEICSEGRDVKLVTNSVESGANIWGCADYMNQRKKLKATGIKFYECSMEHSSHAKTVLIDDNISVIGSFNYDMRSAYIDTELMLVIESPELNKYLREVNANNMAHSRLVNRDGTVVYGDSFTEKKVSVRKKIFYMILRVAIMPIRHLL